MPAPPGVPSRARLLWALYRPLLRTAPSAPVRDEVKRAWRRNAKLTAPAKIARQAGEAEQLLDDFRHLPSSERLQKRYNLLSAHLSALHALRTLNSQPAPAVAPPPLAAKPKRKLTPGILHATTLHGPLPRLKPQPIGTAMMIHRRREQQQRRVDRREWVQEWARDGRAEDDFERRLALQADRDGLGEVGRVLEEERRRAGSYAAGWRAELDRLDGCRNREAKRSALKVPAEMYKAASEAGRRREQSRARRVQTEPSRS